MSMPISSSPSQQPSQILAPVSGSVPSLDDIKTMAPNLIKQTISALPQADRKNWANSQNERGQTPLAIIIESTVDSVSKLELVKFLVEECDADINIGDKTNWTPLYRACLASRSDIFFYLLDKGANPNAQNSDGSTPLHRLVDNNCLHEIEALLKHEKIDITIINCHGSPLYYAAKHGHVEIAKAFFQHLETKLSIDSGNTSHIEGLLASTLKSYANLVDDPLAITPLAIASNMGRTDMVEFLKGKNAEMLVPSDDPIQTDLSILVASGTDEAILKACKEGKPDSFGRTVIHYCAQAGRVDLLEQMENKDKVDNKGRTPLHYALMQDVSEESKLRTKKAVTHLVESGSQLNTRDNQGYSPIMWCSQFNQDEMAEYLLKAAEDKDPDLLNALLTVRDNFGWLALHKAGEVGNLPILKLLIEAYKTPHDAVITNQTRTALVLAEKTGSNQAAIDYLSDLTKAQSQAINPGNKV
jgi:ankyrin repeat protein